MKKIQLLSLIFIVAIAISSVYFLIFRKPAKEIHYHAGFLVYVDGQLQDFTPSKYMETQPCYTNKVKHPPEDNQKEKAHLHDGIGDVVHVHRANTTWGDLFKNIDFSFPATESAVGYINNTQINDIFHYPIKPDDSAIIVSGDIKAIDLKRYVTVDHIKEIESKSETCGTQ